MKTLDYCKGRSFRDILNQGEKGKLYLDTYAND